MGADLPEFKGKMYVMVVATSAAGAPRLKVDSTGQVEYVGFTPDPASKALFEIIGKNAAQEWRLRAGYCEEPSVYNVKPKP